jgi:hypothetical protein
VTGDGSDDPSISLDIAGPSPSGDLAQGMEFIIVLGMGVLHGNLRTEFDVRSDRLAEITVVGKVGGVERRHIELDESCPLLLGDLKVSVDGNEMGEAELSGESIGTAEGFGREGGEVIDVLRFSRPEEWLEQGIPEDAAVEGVLQAMQRLLATGEFVKRRHTSMVLTDRESRIRFPGAPRYGEQPNVELE